MKNQFLLTREKIARLASTKSSSELAKVLVEELSEYGIHSTLSGIVPRENAAIHEQISGIIFEEWPAEWAQQYFKEKLLDNDPTIRMLRAGSEAFSWKNINAKYDDDKIARSIMGQAGEFGLVDGLTIPIRSIEGTLCAVSFAGSKLEVSKYDLSSIGLIAHFAFATAALHATIPNSAPKLTVRELDIIRWVAEGKSDWDISAILGISEHTVDKHLRNIREKFNVKTRTQIIAHAIRFNIIG